jgi:hypothetical protein
MWIGVDYYSANVAALATKRARKLARSRQIAGDAVRGNARTSYTFCSLGQNPSGGPEDLSSPERSVVSR